MNRIVKRINTLIEEACENHDDTSSNIIYKIFADGTIVSEDKEEKIVTHFYPLGSSLLVLKSGVSFPMVDCLNKVFAISTYDQVVKIRDLIKILFTKYLRPPSHISYGNYMKIMFSERQNH